MPYVVDGRRVRRLVAGLGADTEAGGKDDKGFWVARRGGARVVVAFFDDRFKGMEEVGKAWRSVLDRVLDGVII